MFAQDIKTLNFLVILEVIGFIKKFTRPRKMTDNVKLVV